MAILGSLENGLRDRGWKRYYTMADSKSGFRFNELMGFHSAHEVWDGQFEIMVKEL